MTLIRNLTFRTAAATALLAALSLAGNSSLAQDQDDAAEWVVRVYRVTDLILPRPDYPYDGSEIPTTGRSIGTSDAVYSGLGGGLGGSGFGGGGFGGGFGGGGEGFFQVTDANDSGFGFAAGGGGLGPAVGGLSEGEAGPRFTMEDLINAIQSTIEPMSWDVMGGEAVCTPLGGMLIIKQTPPVHVQIDALLTAIRDEGGSVQSVTLQAHWLLLSPDELAQLIDGSERAPARVNRETLDILSDSRPGYQGRITCFTDQTVHLVSGRRRSTVISAIPVVSATAIGLQPVISLPNIGVLLEVNPTLLTDRESAVLNLVSTVTSAGNAIETVEMVSQGESFDTRLKLDRLDLETHRLATTVRVPLGQPVLVGGLSMAGDSRAGSDEPDDQLYLVVELTTDAGEE